MLHVRLVEAERNLGFSRANNLGMSVARGQYMALINNDTTVDRDWLAALVDAIESDSAVAAVAPKIVFARPFLEVTFEAPAHRPSDHGSTDGREIGVFVHEESAFAGTSYRKPIFGDGFHAPEDILGSRGRWTGSRASLLLPVESRERGARLCLQLLGDAGAGAKRVRIAVGGGCARSVVVGAGYSEHEIDVAASSVRTHATDVINNAGSFLDDLGRSGDRGIFEPDRGQYDSATDIGAVCGCATLLSRAALERVGRFDEDFFMYFEDTELSWRLRKAGYRLRYQPSSVVRHHHASTSGEYSPLFRYHVTRNRILMLVRHAPLRVAARAYIEEVWRTCALWRASRRAQAAGLGADTSGDLAVRLDVQKSLLRQIPRFLRKRWSAGQPAAGG